MDYGIDETMKKEAINDMKDPGEGQPQNAFLMKVNDCSSVLIHEDWLLASQKCAIIKGALKRNDENGNLVYAEGTDFSKIKVTKARGALEKPRWSQPFKLEVSSDGDDSVWRKVEHIVMEPSFSGDGSEYLGGDVALIKLARKVKTPENGFIAPICLPDVDFTDFTDDLSDQLYFAGFGRRRIQFCVTNMRGPDKFNICGRSKVCLEKTAYMEKKCPLEFMYKNQTYDKCLTIPNPSMEDPICVRLSQASSFNETVYVFSSDMQKVLAICIPPTVQLREKGWCITQGPMDKMLSEPLQPAASWGFCGSEDDQLQCATSIDDKLYNTAKIPVSRFNDQFCLEQLENNLRYEMVKTADTDKFLKNVICVGKNVSNDWQNVKAYKFIDKNNTFYRQTIDEEALELLARANISKYGLDGAACLGDSGAPLFKYVEDNGIEKPVLVGIFSFLLWGTCRGRNEPSYFSKVKAYMDNFILKYIPKNETCIVSTKVISKKF